MVTHVVLWNVNEGINKEEMAKEMQAMVAKFAPEVPGLQTIAVQSGYQGYDICLISTHDDKEAVEAYQIFPAHVALKEYVGARTAGRAACDFES